MSEWPITVCRGCGRNAPTSRDLTGEGCEGRHEQVIPADLGRELYEATATLMSLVGPPEDIWENARRRVLDALARYEREVGE